MNNLFAILIVLSVLGFVVALIKPSWLRLKSRKQSSLLFGICTVIFFLLFGMTAPSDITNQETKTSQPTQVAASTNKTVSSTPPSASIPVSLQDQITQAVTTAIGTSNNMGKPRVVSVEVDQYHGPNLKLYGYKPTDKINGVLITINASENLTNNLTKLGMAMDAAKIFQAVFPLSPQIGDVVIWSQLSLKDEYGNVKDGTAETFAMGQPLFKKINWTNTEPQDLPTLLNNESSIDDRNGSRVLISNF